ncbi:MAG TPA: DUF5666 domain-containing protein [Burkholderiaceae bacterium]|jgi:hypothetical protein|nr:DUF5666 domain-containing protein [Burkholderiaceae bacterium]
MHAKILSIKTITAALSLACGLALTGCGGGGGGATPQPTAAKTKRVFGVVHGSAAAPTLGGRSLVISGAVTANGVAAPASAIQPGTVVRGKATSVAAGTITMASADLKIEVEGPIQAVDVTGSTIQVLSQTVMLDALTEIVQTAPDGKPTSLTLKDLAVNDVVEVSGFRTANGIQATRIERQPAGTFSPDELSGTVASLDTTAKTFMIGTELVDYSQATVNGTLENGAQVEVAGTLNGTTLSATAVSIDSQDAESGDDDVEFDGVVSALDTTAMTFQLGDKTIDYSGVSNPPSLSNGAEVEVQGTVDASNTSLVHATEISVEESHGGSGSADGEAAGKVTAIDASMSVITVGATTFHFDAQTVITKNDSQITAADIMVADVVEVKFDDTKLVNGQAYATEIEVQTGASATDNAVEGKITSFNAAASTFVVGGVTVQVTSSTSYETLDKTLTQADFFGTDRTGQQVIVGGTQSTTSPPTIAATRIELVSH